MHAVRHLEADAEPVAEAGLLDLEVAFEEGEFLVQRGFLGVARG